MRSQSMANGLNFSGLDKITINIDSAGVKQSCPCPSRSYAHFLQLLVYGETIKQSSQSLSLHNDAISWVVNRESNPGFQTNWNQITQPSLQILEVVFFCKQGTRL